MKQTEQHKKTSQQAAGVVISTASGKAYAAVMRRRGDGFERTYEAAFDLSEGLDIVVRQVLEKSGDVQMPVVIGLDSAQIRFLDISLPPVPTAQLPLLIRTQAEAQLPLDGSRMQVAWRLWPATQGYDCTVAAVRLDVMDTSLKRQSLNGTLTAMVPDAAGFARLRQVFFAPTPEECLVLRRREEGFSLMMLEGASPARCAVIHTDPSDVAQRPGLVMQDILMEMDALEQKHGRKCPVYIWPGDDPFLIRVAESLTQSGRQVGTLQTNQTAVRQARLEDGQDLNSPRFDAAGLAILGLSETAPAFDFLQMQRLAQPAEDAKLRRKKVMRTVWAMAVLVVLAALAHYWGLSLQVQQLQRELASEFGDLKAETLLQRLAYQEATARARLDVLEMIQVIQDSRDGMLLDSIEFEKGKPVKLIATAGGYEQVYGFQKRLEAHDGVSLVRLVDPRLDERTRQVRFTMQFNYKNFSK